MSADQSPAIFAQSVGGGGGNGGASTTNSSAGEYSGSLALGGNGTAGGAGGSVTVTTIGTLQTTGANPPASSPSRWACWRQWRLVHHHLVLSGAVSLALGLGGSSSAVATAER